MDADEWLDADISQLVTFLHSEEAKCNDEARVIQRNYADRDLEEYTDFFAARVGPDAGREAALLCPDP